MLIQLLINKMKTRNCLFLLSVVFSSFMILLISNSDLSKISLVYALPENYTISENINNLSTQADSLFKAGNYEEALKLYEKILDSVPENVTALKRKGDSLSRLGDYQAAIGWYDRALSIDPNNVDVLNNKGIALLNSGQKDIALEMYDRALDINPNYTKAMINKASLSFFSNLEINRAVYWIDKALIIEPENVQAIGIKANFLFIKGQFENALNLSDSALRIESDDASALLYRGLSLIELKRYDEAVETLDTLVKINPNNKYLVSLLEQTKLRTK